MIFDQPPAELPVATLVPRDGKSQLRADLYTWFAAKWQWFKPRTVPMVVAFVGMLAVIGSANWLRNYARRAPDRLVEQTKRPALVVVDAAPEPTAIVVEVGPPEVVVTIDGEATKLPEIQLEPSHCGARIETVK